MAGIQTRIAIPEDLPRLTEIYNYFVTNTPVTFDLEPWTVERRVSWFEQFAARGRYRLLVATDGDLVVGYAGTTRFRVKAAYDATVEATIYCAPGLEGKGLGTRLYADLFAALTGEDVHRVVACYVPPNPATAALHARFGFRPVGTFSECGYKFGRHWDTCWLERPLTL